VDMAKPMAISSFRYVPTSANQAADCLAKRELSFGLMISDVYDNVPIFFFVKISFGRCNAFWQVYEILVCHKCRSNISNFKHVKFMRSLYHKCLINISNFKH
jgi:hypothetical protein